MSKGQGEQITSEQAELDGYFEAWARTLVDQIGSWQTIEGGALYTTNADLRRMATALLKQELLDAWHHQPGDGAPPECVAFLNKHSPWNRLITAMPFLDPKNPVGDLMARFESQGQALLESAKKQESQPCPTCESPMTRESDTSDFMLRTIHVCYQCKYNELVKERNTELTECREMVGALLGIKYTRAGARETFDAWNAECQKQGRHIPLPPIPSCHIHMTFNVSGTNDDKQLAERIEQGIRAVLSNVNGDS